MDAVGTDHHVERSWGAVLEGHVDPVLGLDERADRIAEHVLARLGREVVQDSGKVTARNVDLAARECARDDADLAAGGVDDRTVVVFDAGALDGVEDAHLLKDGPVGRALEVDRLAAGADFVGLLDDSDVESVSVQPEGQGGSGDAGAGDEYAGVAHVRSPVDWWSFVPWLAMPWKVRSRSSKARFAASLM